MIDLPERTLTSDQVQTDDVRCPWCRHCADDAVLTLGDVFDAWRRGALVHPQNAYARGVEVVDGLEVDCPRCARPFLAVLNRHHGSRELVCAPVRTQADQEYLSRRT